MKKVFKVYIFRHGQTFYNKNKIFTGWKDSKLTPKGICDARKISKKLENKTFKIAFCTRLSRSRNTLKEVLKFHPECKKIIKDDRIIERSYGIFEGISHKEFIKKFGKKKFNLIHRGYNTSAPKGESFKDVEIRVRKFIQDLKNLIKKEKTDVAISAHGNSIRLFRKIIEKSSVKQATSWFIPYDKVFVYKFRI